MKKLISRSLLVAIPAGILVGSYLLFAAMCRSEDYRCHLMYHGTSHAYTNCDWCQGRTHDTYTLGF
jgi:hypothetical protein